MESRVPARRRHHIARATPRELYDIVADFPAYPRLFPEVKEARVLSETNTPKGKVTRVEFRAQMVVAIRYVLELTGSGGEGGTLPTLSWTYVEGEIVTNNEGSWTFTPEGDGTAVEYAAFMDVRAPVPGFVMRKIIDGLVALSLPNMFASLEREARRRQASAPTAPVPSSAT
jgi:ribosome-associated toxin RatA of RatAB toxin-antitoxin module